MIASDDSPTASPAPTFAAYHPRAPPPFHLLELTVLSAQELAVLSRSRPTYAVVWVDPANKVSTALDRSGSAFPSWNDRFVFRVPHAFLLSDTAAVTIQIRSSLRRPRFLAPLLRRIRPDPVLGTARLVVSTMRASGLFPTPSFVALQVRRPSSRPQGMVNVGVAMLDGSASALPWYYEAGAPSAVSCRELCGWGWEGKGMVKKDEAGLRRMPTMVGEEGKGPKVSDWTEDEEEEASSRRQPLHRRRRGLSCFCGGHAVHGYEEGDW